MHNFLSNVENKIFKILKFWDMHIDILKIRQSYV